ncbi:UNVERIFIED_CONTAM: putative inactive histone-lysine N-methyltransferase SUVR1 [Sesamum radiatum]|uniref:Inactive histone-lysine N-methyltransferase SUVR1 n=1 Tax=Sesamum radiatum TaxID=300843 RepID=A0AAW2W7T8_SESRA
MSNKEIKMRAANAFRAMKAIGISEDKVKPVLKNLVKLYDKNWGLIEAENYRALADAIFEREEAEAQQRSKKVVNTEADERPKKIVNGELGFFTTRKVKAMEELTWDYGIEFDDSDHPIKAFRCQCGSKFCRNIKRSSSPQMLNQFYRLQFSGDLAQVNLVSRLLWFLLLTQLPL